MGTRRIRRDDGDYTLFFRKVSPFSNHHPADFICDQSINESSPKRFSCTEQYYMYNKASLMKNKHLMRAVLNSETPRAMKSMCSRGALSGWDDSVWDEHKTDVMHTGCLAKFRSSRPLRYALFLSTGSKLVECSPFDSIWGIGKDLEAAESGSVNSGKNLLGKILDQVREELWDDPDYEDETKEVTKRMENDAKYLMKAMKNVDLMYKARALMRYLIANSHKSHDDQSYLTSEVRSLLPDWALPSPILKNESILPSPPQITRFRSISPVRNRSETRPLVSHCGRQLFETASSEKPEEISVDQRVSRRSSFRSTFGEYEEFEKKIRYEKERKHRKRCGKILEVGREVVTEMGKKGGFVINLPQTKKKSVHITQTKNEAVGTKESTVTVPNQEIDLEDLNPGKIIEEEERNDHRDSRKTKKDGAREHHWLRSHRQ